MAEKLLIALNCEKESAEKMLWQLQQEGLDIAEVLKISVRF